ncbi:MAG: hypothetical protein PHZ19_09900 [Candidatus Thermoplasmatota archaeon]|nr:hypothetical protein [Candidatus Thermoplasmatota archaeon]
MRQTRTRNMVLGVVVAALLALPAIQAYSTGEEREPLLATGHIEPVAEPGGQFTPDTEPVSACVGNVQLTSDQEDERHPAIAQAFDGSFVVAYDKQVSPLTGHIYFLRSTDNGDTWTEVWNTDTEAGDMNTGLQNWPAICNVPEGNALFGSWNDEAQGIIFFINVSDPASAASYEAMLGGYDASDWDYDRSMFTVEAYSPQRLSVGHVGHVIYAGYDLPSASQIITFTTGYQGSFGITGDEDYPISYNNEIGITDNYFWLAWDSPDEDTGNSYLVVKWGDPDEEGDAHLWPETEFRSGASYMDPAFDASGTSLVMVYMSNDNIYGDWDLAVKYSTDEGSTWQDGSFPSQPQVDEKSPEIFMSGSTVFCTFIREGNLYLTKSTDLGQTWEDPERINDQDGTVVEEPGAVAVSEGGIAWEDTRNGNIDIYYAPLPTAILNVESVSGGLGLSATVSNTGTVAAENVEWSIQFSGLVFLGNTAGTIPLLEPGETETISTGLVFGIGPSTITITVGGASRTFSGLVLGPLVLGL